MTKHNYKWIIILLCVVAIALAVWGISTTMSKNDNKSSENYNNEDEKADILVKFTSDSGELEENSFEFIRNNTNYTEDQYGTVMLPNGTKSITLQLHDESDRMHLCGSSVVMPLVFLHNGVNVPYYSLENVKTYVPQGVRLNKNSTVTLNLPQGVYGEQSDMRFAAGQYGKLCASGYKSFSKQSIYYKSAKNES